MACNTRLPWQPARLQLGHGPHDRRGGLCLADVILTDRSPQDDNQQTQPARPAACLSLAPMTPKPKTPPPVEYQYDPSPDAAEKLNQAYDLILDLLIQDYQNEQSEKTQPDQPEPPAA